MRDTISGTSLIVLDAPVWHYVPEAAVWLLIGGDLLAHHLLGGYSQVKGGPPPPFPCCSMKTRH